MVLLLVVVLVVMVVVCTAVAALAADAVDPGILSLVVLLQPPQPQQQQLLQLLLWPCSSCCPDASVNASLVLLLLGLCCVCHCSWGLCRPCLRLFMNLPRERTRSLSCPSSPLLLDLCELMCLLLVRAFVAAACAAVALVLLLPLPVLRLVPLLHRVHSVLILCLVLLAAAASVMSGRVARTPSMVFPMSFACALACLRTGFVLLLSVLIAFVCSVRCVCQSFRPSPCACCRFHVRLCPC